MPGSENDSTTMVLARKQKRNTYEASSPTEVRKDKLFIRLIHSSHSPVQLTHYGTNITQM